jgi:hypothetical protein
LYLDRPLINKYGGHADQLSRRHWGMDRFRIEALNKILSSGELGSDNAQAAQAMLAEKCRIVAQGAAKRGNHALARYYQQLPLQYSTPSASAAGSHA